MKNKIQPTGTILMMLLIAATFNSCLKKKPTASFTYTLDNNTMGLVHFTNTSTDAVDYSWNFGGGAVSGLKDPDHTYKFNVDQTVILTAYSKAHEKGKNAVYIGTVTVTNAPYCTALVKGASVSSYDPKGGAYATKDASLITVISDSHQNTCQAIKFTLPAGAAPGTYDISNSLVSFSYDSDCSYSYAYHASNTLNCSSGSITITSVTQTQIHGTFQCKVYNNSCAGFEISEDKFGVSFQ